MKQKDIINQIKKISSRKINKQTIITEAHFADCGWIPVNETIASFVENYYPTNLDFICVQGVGDVAISVFNFEWDYEDCDFSVSTSCHCSNQYGNVVIEIEADSIRAMKEQAKNFAKENNMIFNDLGGGDLPGYRSAFLAVENANKNW